MLRHISPLASAGCCWQEVDQASSKVQVSSCQAQQIRKALRQGVSLSARVAILNLHIENQMLGWKLAVDASSLMLNVESCSHYSI